MTKIATPSGCYVVFDSEATDLVARDTNGTAGAVRRRGREGSRPSSRASDVESCGPSLPLSA